MNIRSAKLKVLSACLGGALVALSASADPSEGETLFKRQCAVCHSLTPGQVIAGPSLAGVVGRTAGTEKFRYSPGMKASGIVWGPETLDGFIESPRRTVKGTSMAFPGERNEDKRKALVDYLSSTG